MTADPEARRKVSHTPPPSRLRNRTHAGYGPVPQPLAVVPTLTKGSKSDSRNVNKEQPEQSEQPESDTTETPRRIPGPSGVCPASAPQLPGHTGIRPVPEVSPRAPGTELGAALPQIYQSAASETRQESSRSPAVLPIDALRNSTAPKISLSAPKTELGDTSQKKRSAAHANSVTVSGTLPLPLNVNDKCSDRSCTIQVMYALMNRALTIIKVLIRAWDAALLRAVQYSGGLSSPKASATADRIMLTKNMNKHFNELSHNLLVDDHTGCGLTINNRTLGSNTIRRTFLKRYTLPNPSEQKHETGRNHNATEPQRSARPGHRNEEPFRARPAAICEHHPYQPRETADQQYTAAPLSLLHATDTPLMICECPAVSVQGHDDHNSTLPAVPLARIRDNTTQRELNVLPEHDCTDRETAETAAGKKELAQRRDSGEKERERVWEHTRGERKEQWVQRRCSFERKRGCGLSSKLAHQCPHDQRQRNTTAKPLLKKPNVLVKIRLDERNGYDDAQQNESQERRGAEQEAGDDDHGLGEHHI